MPDKILDFGKPKDVVVDHPAPPVFVDDIMPAPMPAPAPTYPTYPKFPVGDGTMIYDGDARVGMPPFGYGLEAYK
jgi:hypothetical protein